nr:hypothetical protein [Tanacetum cinerariifolium]
GKPYLDLWYLKYSPFDLVAYSDSDYASASLDKIYNWRMSIPWMQIDFLAMQKQTVVATSLKEAEYVAAASGCAQVLWIQNQLLDYGNGVNAASSLVSTVGHNFINSTNDFSVAGPSNAAASLTAANSSDMP